VIDRPHDRIEVDTIYSFGNYESQDASFTRVPSNPGPFRGRDQHPRERDRERIREIPEDQEDENQKYLEKELLLKKEQL
jgi:hypothetical protein